jgi:adenine-specific DNA-methyltransferase
MSKGEELAKELAEDFSLERLKDFLFGKDFTVEESQSPIELKEKLKESVLSIKQVAYKELEDIRNFNVYAIELKENITERSSKKRQFEIAKEILKTERLIAGLFVFYPQEGKSFRFSLVFTEPYGTRREYSPYKRYTYFVSPELPNKTFIKQVGGCEFTDLKEIKSAFSVQPLTKEFYKEIQTWFYHALENCGKEIFFPGGREEENLIRLITRLMFVWFIKQMGLVPEKLFDPKELKNIVKDFENGHNYYNAVLQNLFFATLNRPINERGWAKDEGFLKNRNTFGIKSLYRYEDKFLISPEEVLGLFENIPFINGGLFECLDKDSQYIDGFSRRPDKQAKVPDKYFFQKEEQETDLSKYGLGKAKFRGLISIFKDYNWTTDESSGIDQEVALDPELLGKVFENLLASYNPETATTARKATGSYYTPKEIVDYMVEESLKEDFKTKTSLSEEKIETLFYQEEPQLSDEERKELVRAIADVKIIDPACGSGAFCMGALHKLVELLNRIDPTNELWKSEQQRRLTNELSERWEEMTQEERNEERAYLLEVFNEQRNYPDYGRKLYLIQNCIYGVDIQPIAVQLTKLRFFLSLILDQKPSNDKNNNFGILPLPHLETKFVCANTLIGLESSRQRSIKSQEVMKIERELKRIRERYFRVRNRKQKQELEEKDRELREKLAELLKKQGWDNKDVQKIASFDILDPTAKADWFDPEWMFGVVDGFDVVIGNPPYVRQEKIKKDKPLLQKQGYEVFTSTADLYVYFYEKGYQLLKQQGVLAYITSNKWMRAKYGENLRKFLKEKTTIIKLIDFGGYKVFEQTVDTCILLFKKEKPPKGHTFEFLTVPSDVKDLESYLRKIKDLESYLRKIKDLESYLRKIKDLESYLRKIKDLESYLRKIKDLESYLRKIKDLESYLRKIKDLESYLRKIKDLESYLRKIKDLESYLRKIKDLESYLRKIKDLESYLIERSKYLIEQETETVFKRVESWSDVETWQDFRDWQTMLQEKLSNNCWTLGDEKVLSLKEKIEKVGKPLKEWDVKIYFGIKTGYNDAFIIDTETRNRILGNCRDEEERRRTEEIIKPVLEGKDIKKYRYRLAGSWIILATKHTITSCILNYLKKHKEALEKRAGNQEWYELQAPPSKEKINLLLMDKIGYSDIGLRFAFIPNGIVGLNTTYFIIPYKNWENREKVLLYLLGLLNSKLIMFYYRNTAQVLSGKTTRGFSIYIQQLPLPPITKENQPLADQIVQKVQEILTLTQSPDFETSQEKQQKVKELEREIDQLVYKLYGLTEEEIRTMELEK